MNKQCEVCIQQTQEEIKLLKAQVEKLLKICTDKGIVSSWYYAGAYHWELKTSFIKRLIKRGKKRMQMNTVDYILFIISLLQE